jgi:hypothetical protein
MDQIVRNLREEPIAVNEGNPPFDTVIEPSPHGNRFKLLPWLAGVICIFALLYSSSYLALLWLPPPKEVDMSSQLTADYSPWAILVFQPVDPAIIEEIRQEQGLPEQVIIDGSFWPTSISSNATLSNVETQEPGSASTAIHMTASTPIETLINPQSSPVVIQPSQASTPIPTGITSLTEVADTPKPIETHKPEKPPKPEKPEKPPKPDKPSK